MTTPVKTRILALVLALSMLVGGTMSAAAAETTKPDPYTFNTYTIVFLNHAQVDWLFELYCGYLGYSDADVVYGQRIGWRVPITVTCSGLR